MAATASTGDIIHVLKETPVVLSWVDDDSHEPIFLGHTFPVTFSLSFDTANNKATFRIRVAFQFNKKNHESFLYVFIDPSSIKSLQRHSRETALPEAVSQFFLGQTCLGVVGLDLCLEDPPTVIGPAKITRLSPKGNAPGNTLAALRSLSQARSVDLFVPESQSLRSELVNLCDSLSQLTASGDYTFTTLYRGQGGQDISRLLDPFIFRLNPLTGASHVDQSTASEEASGEREAPPAYTDTGARSSDLGTRKRRLSSGKPTSDSKRLLPTDAETASISIHQLRAELDTLRNHIRWQSALAAGTPTEDGRLNDRLDSFEQRLCALEARTPPNTAELVTQLLPPLRTHIDIVLGNLIEERVPQLIEQHLDDHKEEVETRMSDLRDDIVCDVGLKIEQVVGDELGIIVAEQLPEVVEGLMENARLSLHVER